MGLNSLLTFCSCPGVTRADEKRRRNNEIITADDVSTVAEFQWGCFFALSICFLANRNWICGDSCEKPRSTRGLPRLVFAGDSGGNINVFFSQGRSQEFVPKGTKEWVPSPLTSGIHTRTKPRLGSEAKPQKPENMLKFWLNVTNSILVGEKKFSPWQFRRGTCPPCPPLPYAPVFWHPDRRYVETDEADRCERYRVCSSYCMRECYGGQFGPWRCDAIPCENAACWWLPTDRNVIVSLTQRSSVRLGSPVKKLGGNESCTRRNSAVRHTEQIE